MAPKIDVLFQTKGLLHEMAPDALARLKGDVLGLYFASGRHRSATIDEFMASILPAVHFNQFRLYREGGRPVGWVTWAFMSDADAQGFMAGDFEFEVSCWQSGSHLWFLDFIAPYGHALKMAEDLRRGQFADHVGFAPDLESPDGSKRIRRFMGINRRDTEDTDENTSFLKSIGL